MYAQVNEKYLSMISKKIDSLVELDQDNQRKLIDAVNNLEDEGLIKKLNEISEQTYRDNCEAVSKIFNEIGGYPDSEKVGKKSSYNFWLLVQHCDKMPEFQKSVLKHLKVAVKEGKADPKNMAYLTDRVKKNFNKRQIYGTQVFRDSNGTYKPYPIYKIKKVNNRREKVGLGTLEKYLELMNSEQ